MNKPLYTDAPEVQYDESDLKDLVLNPCRFGCDVQLVCTDGNAEISTGIQSYDMHRGCELFLLGGCLIQVNSPSADFRVRVLLYPKDVVMKALLPLDTMFLNYLHEYPYFDHLEENACEQSGKMSMQWMDMARQLFSRPVPNFRRHIEHNFLQTMLMCLYNYIPRKLMAERRESSRKMLLCHQFLRLVRENSAREHLVPFYAERLSISARYLGDIVADNFDGQTPKQLIDKQLIAEIKVQLDNTAMTLSEIAESFNFPEHTCMSRFFKRNTGLSPKEYRLRRR